MSPQRIMLTFGTRPEAIKMAPVVKALKDRPEDFETVACVTAQHRDLLDQVLEIFDIEPQFDLDLMTAGQTLYDVTVGVLTGMREIYTTWKPDLVLVHGDTTTTMAASLAAFYEKIPVGHVEAGLRTGNIYSPWPEEMNRKVTSNIAAHHFAPTETNRSNLLAENIAPESIFVTGNTVIDSLLSTVGRIEADDLLSANLTARTPFIDGSRRIVLVTAHRRENFGAGIEGICKALKRVIMAHDDIELVYPVHPNPNILEPVHRILGSVDRVHLIEPVDYLGFCYLLKASHLVLTDSGGLQEEAPSLGKPVLVMRDTTERPEAVDAGTVRLVGTDPDVIVREASAILNDPSIHAQMARRQNPYGDGLASQRIADAIVSRRTT